MSAHDGYNGGGGQTPFAGAKFEVDAGLEGSTEGSETARCNTVFFSFFFPFLGGMRSFFYVFFLEDGPHRRLRDSAVRVTCAVNGVYFFVFFFCSGGVTDGSELAWCNTVFFLLFFPSFLGEIEGTWGRSKVQAVRGWFLV